MTAGSHTTSATIPDGIYCFYIRTTEPAHAAADGPGLTVLIDRETRRPRSRSRPWRRAVVTGTVTVDRTSADAVSGVASSTLHVGAANACASGAVIGSAWDTPPRRTGLQVCNVVVDNAGHSAISSTTVTVANPWASALPRLEPPAAAELNPAGSLRR